MNLRMTMATAITVLTLVGLAGCGTGDTPAQEPTSSAPTTSATPTTDPSTVPSSLTGRWDDTAAQWTVHFNEDGTFIEDFQGVTDFRVGTYVVDGQTVSLIGDDGNTDKGSIVGETLVFKLGTLTRT